MVDRHCQPEPENRRRSAADRSIPFYLPAPSPARNQRLRRTGRRPRWWVRHRRRVPARDFTSGLRVRVRMVHCVDKEDGNPMRNLPAIRSRFKRAGLGIGIAVLVAGLAPAAQAQIEQAPGAPADRHLPVRRHADSHGRHRPRRQRRLRARPDAGRLPDTGRRRAPRGGVADPGARRPRLQPARAAAAGARGHHPPGTPRPEPDPGTDHRLLRRCDAPGAGGHPPGPPLRQGGGRHPGARRGPGGIDFQRSGRKGGRPHLRPGPREVGGGRTSSAAA